MKSRAGGLGHKGQLKLINKSQDSESPYFDDIRHRLLYVELIDEPGTEHDRLVVRSYTGKDKWGHS